MNRCVVVIEMIKQRTKFKVIEVKCREKVEISSKTIYNRIIKGVFWYLE